MSIHLPVKIFALVSFLTMIARNPVNAQQGIEKYLLDQGLISTSQYKKYTDKKNNEDEYSRLMLKMMKKEKGGRKYVKQMEKEYQEEVEKRKPKNDTLTILANILELSRKQRYSQPMPDTQNNSSPKPYTYKLVANDTAEIRSLTSYATQLKNKGLISEGAFRGLSDHIVESDIYDSCGLVKNAVGIMKKESLTTKPKLLELMTLLKDLKVLSLNKYQQLVNSTVPDTVNKIFNIVSNCDNILFLDHNTNLVRDRDEFMKLINALSKLTGIEVTDPSLRTVELRGNDPHYRWITIIELYHNGKRFSHEGPEMMAPEKKSDTFPLFGQDFNKVFNKILIYKNSPFRIHEVSETLSSDYIYKPWSGYILFNRTQSDGLYRNENINISYEENIDPLSIANILKAIDLYKKAGLFNKVTQSDIDSVLQSIKEYPVFRYNELISRFPNISIHVDDRFNPTEEELIDQIKKLAEFSEYRFDPKNIRIVKGSYGRNQILFELNSKTYTDDLDPWNLDAWRVVNYPVITEFKENLFHTLRYDQHKEFFFYLPDKQMKMLEKEKVINDW